MLLALSCHLAIAIIGQLFLGDMYELTAVEHGASIGPSYFANSLHTLKVFGVMLILDVAGIWLIKLNFLLFFHRLSNHVAVYRMIWWIIFVFSRLVGFTLAVTIVRGSTFGGVYKSTNNEVNITWVAFWFYVEFTVCEWEHLHTPRYLGT